MPTALCPTQQQLCDHLLSALPQASVLVIEADSGMGKTTLLREIQHRHGGVLLSMKDLIEVMRSRHPLALEEAFHEWVNQALNSSPCVLLDDLDMLRDVVAGCSAYPRPGLLELALASLAVRAVEA